MNYPIVLLLILAQFLKELSLIAEGIANVKSMGRFLFGWVRPMS